MKSISDRFFKKKFTLHLHYTLTYNTKSLIVTARGLVPLWIFLTKMQH